MKIIRAAMIFVSESGCSLLRSIGEVAFECDEDDEANECEDEADGKDGIEGESVLVSKSISTSK